MGSWSAACHNSKVVSTVLFFKRLETGRTPRVCNGQFPTDFEILRTRLNWQQLALECQTSNTNWPYRCCQVESEQTIPLLPIFTINIQPMTPLTHCLRTRCCSHKSFLQFGAFWCNLLQFSKTWCSLVQLGALRLTLVQFGTTWCNLVHFGAH